VLRLTVLIAREEDYNSLDLPNYYFSAAASCIIIIQ